MFSGFDWDKGNQEKCQKHGVSAAEIEALFDDALAMLPDPRHAKVEERFKAIGKAQHGRYIFLVFTIRVKGTERLIRPISARYMHQKEVEQYAKENPDV